MDCITPSRITQDQHVTPWALGHGRCLGSPGHCSVAHVPHRCPPASLLPLQSQSEISEHTTLTSIGFSTFSKSLVLICWPHNKSVSNRNSLISWHSFYQTFNKLLSDRTTPDWRKTQSTIKVNVISSSPSDHEYYQWGGVMTGQA